MVLVFAFDTGLHTTLAVSLSVLCAVHRFGVLSRAGYALLSQRPGPGCGPRANQARGGRVQHQPRAGHGPSAHGAHAGKSVGVGV